MTSPIDLIGLAASIKELAPLFLKETNPAEIYTRLIGEQIRNRCGPSAVFDEDVFKTRLKQKSIDLLQLPITGDELTHSIGSTVSDILLDNSVVYGVDITPIVRSRLFVTHMPNTPLNCSRRFLKKECFCSCKASST